MSLKDKPHYTLRAATLAEWINSQPEKWWSVDGDPMLMSTVDFPCPNDELAPAILRAGKDLLLLRDMKPNLLLEGAEIGKQDLDAMVVPSNKRHPPTLHLAWENSDLDWFLFEDDPLI